MNPLSLDMLDGSTASAASPSPWDSTMTADGQSGVLSTTPFVVDVAPPQLLYTPRPQAPPPQPTAQRCLPMSQILPPTHLPEAVTPAALSTTNKRPPSPVPLHASSPASSEPPESAPPAAKKSRATRISTADFVPPDVTGLTKREARLVKNRAAAFLSRQRKREEFEGMEVRVTELENENARLRALASSGTPTPAALSELEQLRQQLAAAEQREQRLQAEMQSLRLGHRAASVDPPPASTPSLAPSRQPSVKLEESDSLDASTKLVRRHSDKAGPSLGLMVLLFSLSTLISLQKSTSGTSTHGSVPTRFSFSPVPPQAGASQSSLMLDNLMAHFPKTLNAADGDDEMMDDFAPSATQSAALQQVSNAIAGTSSAQFEIDFDLPSPTGEADTAIATLGDQKIRVRIHNSPRAGTASHTSTSPKIKQEDTTFLDWDPSETPSSLPFSDLITGHGDLFGGDSTTGFGDGTSFGTFAPNFGLSSKEADLAAFIDQDVFGSGAVLQAASPAPSTTESSSSAGLSVADGTKGNDWLALAPSPPGSPIASYRPFSTLRKSSTPDVVGAGGKKKVRIAVRQGTGADSGEWEVEVLDRS